jgi:hypothetical protein
MKREDVIKRLKAADEADRKGMKAGRAFGRKWAEETASPRFLRLVASLVNRPVVTDDENGPSYPGISNFCYRIASVVVENSGTWDEVKAHCEGLGEGGAYLIESEDFAIGFVKGANEVWGEVEDQL